jgi:hypothetical protein
MLHPAHAVGQGNRGDLLEAFAQLQGTGHRRPGVFDLMRAEQSGFGQQQGADIILIAQPFRAASRRPVPAKGQHLRANRRRAQIDHR